MIVAVVGIGGFTLYQWQAPDAVTRPMPAAPATAPASAEPPAPAGAETPPGAPGAPPAAAAPASAPAFSPPTASASPMPVAPPAPASTGPAAGAAAPAAAATAPAPADAAAARQAVGNGKIHLVFSQESWTEVRQSNGQIVFSRQSAPGSEAWVDGQPPFDFVIGNAPAVKLFYRGNPVDLAPYTKVSVARMQLK
jgi:cytoskeleton protein RodZ